jgi:hypothetical protein
MDTITSNLQKWTNWRNALIVLGLFILNAILLGALDQPLLDLASGEPKLDLRFGYDLDTVEMLFGSYGEMGRSIYIWNLLVDTPFPLLGGMATILFIHLSIEHERSRRVLILAPIVFMVTDIAENILILSMLGAYPSLSLSLVTVTSLITQVKRAAFYISAGILLFSLIIAAISLIRRKTPRGAV